MGGAEQNGAHSHGALRSNKKYSERRLHNLSTTCGREAFGRTASFKHFSVCRSEPKDKSMMLHPVAQFRPTKREILRVDFHVLSICKAHLHSRIDGPKFANARAREPGVVRDYRRVGPASSEDCAKIAAAALSDPSWIADSQPGPHQETHKASHFSGGRPRLCRCQCPCRVNASSAMSSLHWCQLWFDRQRRARPNKRSFGAATMRAIRRRIIFAKN